MRSLSRRLALIAGALLCSSAALAQPFPNKPIKAVVPFAAGSATDQIGRAFAAEMSKTLGQTIVIENKPGVNGMLGAADVAKAAPLSDFETLTEKVVQLAKDADARDDFSLMGEDGQPITAELVEGPDLRGDLLKAFRQIETIAGHINVKLPA